MTPRTQALAYRIWAFATPKGWNVTAYDIAEALDVQVARVHHVLSVKGWNARTRNNRTEQLYASIGYAQRGNEMAVAGALARGAHRAANRIPLEG